MGKEKRAPARRFEDLIVWQKAHQLLLMIYKLTEGFPPEERYRMTAQLRDAAGSITSNTSEGFRRETLADKNRFLNIAQASADEVRNWLIVARDLRYGKAGEAASCLLQQEEVARLLNAYRGSIRARMSSRRRR
jgi:four helix bundle protein